MLKKYIHNETGGDVIVSDQVQIDALITEGFIYKCDVERKKETLLDEDGNPEKDENGKKIFYDVFIEVEPKKKK